MSARYCVDTTDPDVSLVVSGEHVEHVVDFVIAQHNGYEVCAVITAETSILLGEQLVQFGEEALHRQQGGS